MVPTWSGIRFFVSRSVWDQDLNRSGSISWTSFRYTKISTSKSTQQSVKIYLPRYANTYLYIYTHLCFFLKKKKKKKKKKNQSLKYVFHLYHACVICFAGTPLAGNHKDNSFWPFAGHPRSHIGTVGYLKTKIPLGGTEPRSNSRHGKIDLSCGVCFFFSPVDPMVKCLSGDIYIHVDI